jgi:hypothetical protein
MIDLMLNLYKEYQSGRTSTGSGKEIEEVKKFPRIV